jgi:hypothetical protein
MSRCLLSLTSSLACWAASAGAAISVGPAGSGVLTFDTLPAVGEWSTLALAGGGATFTNTAALDAAVQLLTASNINGTLPATATVPPSVSGAGARWNSSAHYLQTRPGGVAAVLLMATVRNDTGVAQTCLDVSYSMYVSSPFSEELPGHRIYCSLTGESNSWQLIPGLAGVETPGSLSAVLELCCWPTGGLLYLLWADDNGDGRTDAGYAIDNVWMGLPGRPPFPPPLLRITRLNATQAELAWPLLAFGCALQSATDLADGRWEAVSEVDTPVGDFHHVTVDISTGKRFFRLHKP